MPENPVPRGRKATRSRQQDRRRINLSERHEVRYWTEALGISEECLRDTVAQFGNRVKDVREAIEHLRAAVKAGPRPARRVTPSR